MCRARELRSNLADDQPALKTMPQIEVNVAASINLTKFNPDRRDVNVWAQHGVAEPLRLLYCGRVSVEKNLPLLAEAFSILCGKRRDAALVIVGEGPHHTAVAADDAGIVVIYAGHYATETLGVRAVAEHLTETFGIPSTFIAAPTGL